MYKSIEKISLEEFMCRMNLIPQKNRRPRKRNWMRLIEENKLICPVTKKVVSYCSLDQNMKGAKTFHYNFYSDDGDMFTIDHIHPVSKGGEREALKNIQPMIDIHNFDKADKLDYKYE